ncbi:hypothetical protein IWQ61_002744 [Dispira simplex]|nr:hypothetical protein IWQ61_002744 [Dispira simplex]
MTLVGIQWGRLGLWVLLINVLTSINYREVQGRSLATEFKIEPLDNGKIPVLVVAPIIPEKGPEGKSVPALNSNPALVEAPKESSQVKSDEGHPSNIPAEKERTPTSKAIVQRPSSWNWLRPTSLPSPTALVNAAASYALSAMKKAGSWWESFRGLRRSESTPNLVAQSQADTTIRPPLQRQSSLPPGPTKGVSQLLEHSGNRDTLKK